MHFSCGAPWCHNFFSDSVLSCFHPWFLVQRRTANRGDAAVSKAVNAVMRASFWTSFAISAAVWMGVGKKEGTRGGEGSGELFIPPLFWEWSDFPSLGTIGPLCLFSGSEGKREGEHLHTYTLSHMHTCTGDIREGCNMCSLAHQWGSFLPRTLSSLILQPWDSCTCVYGGGVANCLHSFIHIRMPITLQR